LKNAWLDLKSARLRANPQYALLAFNELSPEAQNFARPFADDPEFFGLLTPRDGAALPAKAVQTGDALLFLKLRDGGIVPDRFWRNEKFEQYLWQLLLDRVVELERDGQYVSGKSLVDFATGPPDAAPSISEKALRYAATIALDNPQILAGRLYFFNRIPVRLNEKSVPTDRSGMTVFLGLQENPAFMADARFQEQQPSPDNISWISWRSAGLRKTVASPVKLYVCPNPGDLPAVFRRCIPVFGQRGAFSVKVAADSFTVCRPDKFVAYFNTLAELQACASELAAALPHLPVHELPFAGALPHPLLAWGMDPPKKPGGASGQPQMESWRSWLAHRLAAALTLARQQGCNPAEAVHFAKNRVSLEGVDILTWAPAGAQFP